MTFKSWVIQEEGKDPADWIFAAAWAFLQLQRARLLSIAVRGLLIAVASLAAEHGLSGAQTSAAAAHGLSSYSSQTIEHRLNGCGAWTLFHGKWDLPGSNPCLLHWKGDSLLLRHQGSPCFFLFNDHLRCCYLDIA